MEKFRDGYTIQKLDKFDVDFIKNFGCDKNELLEALKRIFLT